LELVGQRALARRVRSKCPRRPDPAAIYQSLAAPEICAMVNIRCATGERPGLASMDTFSWSASLGIALVVVIVLGYLAGAF